MLSPGQACPGAKFTVDQTPKAFTLKTGALTVSLSRLNGAVTYTNAAGETLLREGRDVARTYKPMEANGEQTFEVEDRFSPDATEGFYGLGQHQSGMFNYRGSTVELAQNNTDVAIPFLISTKGYALLWNSAAFSYADNRFPLEFSFTSQAEKNIDYYVIAGPEMDQIIHRYRSLTGPRPHASPCGPTVSSSPRIATSPPKRSSASPTATAPSTSPSTPSCRTGSGGSRRATPSSTATTTTSPPTSKSSTTSTSTP